MFKALPRLLTALFVLVTLMSNADAARAQDSTDTEPATRAAEGEQSAEPPRLQDSAQDEATDVSADASESVRQGSQQTKPNSQAGGAAQAKNKPAPLTSGEKVRGAFRAAFLSPRPYLTSALSAGITQLREDRLPHKTNGDEAADWGSRAARNFATRTTTTLFASGFYPALFKQDPRYEPSPRKGFARRTLHAVSRIFVTRDDEGDLEPNYSRFAGVMTASAFANVWEHSTPDHDRIGADATLRRFALSFATGSLNNIVFKEFLPDIIRIFRH
jgi:hypothetical protein